MPAIILIAKNTNLEDCTLKNSDTVVRKTESARGLCCEKRSRVAFPYIETPDANFEEQRGIHQYKRTATAQHRDK